MTEIETVKVTAAEFKENMDHYLELKETTRVVVMHGDEPMMAIGPWLPGEERYLPPRWFWDEIFPPEPIDWTCRASRALLEDRGVIPVTAMGSFRRPTSTTPSRASRWRSRPTSTC